MIRRVRDFVSMGGKVGMSVVRDKLGFPDPEPDEELLHAPASAAREAQGKVDPPDDISATPEAPGKREAHAASLLNNAVKMPPRDWIDDMADEALETDDGWRPLAEPMTRPVLDLAERCSSFEEFEDGLADLVPAQDTRAMALALGRALFVARAAAETRDQDA